MRRRLRGDRGTAAVEFAIVLPVFLALILGGLSFGLAMSTKSVLNQAAADGARAAVGGTGSTYATLASNEATNEMSGSGLPLKNKQVSSTTTSPCPVLGSGTCVTVTTTASPILSLGFSFFGTYIGVPSTLTSTATVEVQ